MIDPLFKDWLKATDPYTQESFGAYASRTGMSMDEMQAGFRWQQKVDARRNRPEVTPVS